MNAAISASSYRTLQSLARALTTAGRQATMHGSLEGGAYFASARELSPGSPTYARLLRAPTPEAFRDELSRVFAGARPEVRRVLEEWSGFAAPA